MTSAVVGSLNELSAAVEVEAYEDKDENEDRKEG